MNTITKLLTLFVALCTVVSCTREDDLVASGNESSGGKGIYLSFTDGTDTRSTLQSSEVDYHDVEQVYLYVFQGTEGTASCVLQESVKWDKDGDISQEHWIGADLDEGATYTFLAVGVDDRAGTVYGFPGDWEGHTLAEIMATYAGSNKVDLKTAQLFSGYQSAKVTDGKATVEITLRRKVAGVLVYLKNIPCTVDYAEANNSEATVTGLRLRLCDDQHTSMSMWPVSTSTHPIYGTGELDGSDVLYEVDFAEAGYFPDDEGRYFTKEGIHTEELETVDNSLLTGVYLLPLRNDTEKHTLSLELIGDYTTGDGVNHEGVEVKQYTITNNADNSTDFSIEENKLYCIGKKLSDASTDGDKPADLSGNILQVFVEEWCGHDVDNWFPTVQGPARIEVEYNATNYIFDAPGTQFTAYIRAAEPVAEWIMSVAYDEQGDGSYDYSDEKGWIHFIGEDEQGLPVENVTTMKGSKDRPITVVLNDFAVQRTLEQRDGKGSAYYIETLPLVEKLKRDYRTAYIEIRTAGTAEPFRLRVRQYNALTVYTSSTKDDDGWRAASRLDYGCHFDLDTGDEVRTDTASIGWGYFATIPHNIAGKDKMDYYDGEKNTEGGYERWQENKYGGDIFPISLMGKMRKEVIEINDEGVNTGTRVWYMPAYHEMWGIAHYVNPYRDTGDACQELFNLKQGTNYWCSTSVDYDISTTLYIPAGTTDYMRKADRHSSFSARAMRKFNE